MTYRASSGRGRPSDGPAHERPHGTRSAARENPVHAHLNLDPISSVPIYAQIIDQIRSLVASRTLRAGDRLLSVRELAESLRINRNTASKAYRKLEAEGVIETRQGQGCFIAGGAPRWSRSERHRRLDAVLDNALLEARRLGIPVEEIPALVEKRIQGFALADSMKALKE